MRPGALSLLLALTGAALALDTVTVKAPQFEATVANGTLAELKTGGTQMIVPADLNLTGVLRVGKDHMLTPVEAEAATVAGDQAVRRPYRDLQELPGAVLTNTYALAGDELVVTQQATSPQPGVVGVQWGLGLVPLDYSVLVPGHGGIRLRRDSPASFFQFDYPVGWEAQFVIIEGPGHGFCVWADDAPGRYKRLSVRRRPAGWQLTFATHNNAPFAPQTACTSVAWHLFTYQGDWRVPARRYRDWTVANWRLTPRASQTPAWAKDIRFLVIMGQELPVLEALAQRADPHQTLLYIPGWRQFDYDRMYPDYTANETFPAFVTRAHELGFRVMPHVNYFGCDPKSPEYATFEKYQVRNPWNHEREWWLWERAEPVIKFAYINPACKAWRALQISRWREVVEKYKVDALHLDQTLCIFNDDNGLIDGQTMIEGNLALHRELHEALPEVAISGEGLDEITMRYEAFAQRHAYGLDFVAGTWDRPNLAMAHPICAYLANGFTQPYGYLGMTTPTNSQLYAAWRENYKHWGVIPTFARPAIANLLQPVGFARQCLDEAAAFTRERLDPDLDGPWPEEVCFPYKGTGGVTAAYRGEAGGTSFALDGKGERQELSRVVTGVTEVALPGSIPGWKCYDRTRIFGLDPDAWYPYSPEPRDQAAFHVSSLPNGFTATRVTQTDRMAVVEVRDVGSVTHVALAFDRATCGSQPFEGTAKDALGPLSDSADGAQFIPQGKDIFAHPPWRAQRRNPQTGVLEAGGTGIAYATFPLVLPAAKGSVRFHTDVAMDKGAIGEGKTDGVLYRVTASAPGQPDLRAERLNATDKNEPLDLDLSPLRGLAINLRLEVHPGPKQSATFDWARWYAPRVEVERSERNRIGLVAVPFTQVLCSAGEATVESEPDGLSAVLDLPGTVVLLKDTPTPVGLPLDLAKAPAIVSFIGADGQVLDRPQFASAGPGASTVGGVTRAGLNTHPPDHGITTADYAMVLPPTPAMLQGFVGLRDGSKSEGCGFIVKVNGRQVAYQHQVPGAWKPIEADLSPWAGKPILLSLVTDSEGPYSFDWGAWGEIRLTAK